MKQINLIIGCGYLGRSLLGLLRGERNYVVNRSGQHNPVNAADDNHQLIFNINDKHAWHNIDALAEKSSIRLYFRVPPRQIDDTIFADFIKRLNQLDIKRSILVSSTVVYGNIDRIVDADSLVKIDSERAERQFQVEQDWLENMKAGNVIRLAGIYGPDRIIGCRGIINNEPINGDPDGWLNLIHVDDAAQLIKTISEIEQPERIELGCDGKPIKRRDYYSYLAEQLNQTQPLFSLGSDARGTGRRCDNSITMSRSGWQPLHVDFRKAVSKLIKQSGN